MSDLTPDEKAAFAALRKQIHVEFAIRLIAIEVATAALLLRSWPGQPMQVAAAIAGGSLIGLSVHRIRVQRLWRAIMKLADNTLAALTVITDLAEERETRKMPVDAATLFVLFTCLAVSLYCFFA